MFKRKLKGMSKNTKGTLTILIREIQDIHPKYKEEILNSIKEGDINKCCEAWLKAKDDLDVLLNSWIKPNNLHPEDVQVLKSDGLVYLHSTPEGFKLSLGEKNDA